MKPYVAPKVTTIKGQQIVESLGYASAIVPYGEPGIGD